MFSETQLNQRAQELIRRHRGPFCTWGICNTTRDKGSVYEQIEAVRERVHFDLEILEHKGADTETLTILGSREMKEVLCGEGDFFIHANLIAEFVVRNDLETDELRIESSLGESVVFLVGAERFWK